MKFKDLPVEARIGAAVTFPLDSIFRDNMHVQSYTNEIGLVTKAIFYDDYHNYGTVWVRWLCDMQEYSYEVWWHGFEVVHEV